MTRHFVRFSWLLVYMVASLSFAQLPWNIPHGVTTYSTVALDNPVNWSSPLNRGLVAWFLELPQINHAGTIWRDITRKGNNGTMTAMATPATATSGRGRTARPGGYGEMRFDGVSDYVSIGKTAALNISEAVTISLWIKLSTTAGGVTVIIGQATDAANETQYSFDVNRTAGKLECLANSAVLALTGNTTLVVGLWYNTVMTRSGSTGNWTYTIYVNGVNDGSATVADNPTNQGSLSIGRYGGVGSFYFTGSLDDIRIFSRALSAREALSLYAEGRTAYPTTINRLSLVAKAPIGGSVPRTGMKWFGWLFPTLPHWLTEQAPANDDARAFQRAASQ